MQVFEFARLVLGGGTGLRAGTLKFPVFFPDIRELMQETGTHATATPASQCGFPKACPACENWHDIPARGETLRSLWGGILGILAAFSARAT